VTASFWDKKKWQGRKLHFPTDTAIFQHGAQCFNFATNCPPNQGFSAKFTASKSWGVNRHTMQCTAKSTVQKLVTSPGPKTKHSSKLSTWLLIIQVGYNPSQYQDSACGSLSVFFIVKFEFETFFWHRAEFISEKKEKSTVMACEQWFCLSWLSCYYFVIYVNTF